jgi:hypothetical protein
MTSPEPGEITIDEAGNVVIGVPTATLYASALEPGGDEEEGDE